MTDVNELQVLDRTGHTSTKWNPSDADEVRAAREVFDSMTAKGYRAFTATLGGGPGLRMDVFDPEAKRMVLIPQLAGG